MRLSRTYQGKERACHFSGKLKKRLGTFDYSFEVYLICPCFCEFNNLKIPLRVLRLRRTLMYVFCKFPADVPQDADRQLKRQLILFCEEWL